MSVTLELTGFDKIASMLDPGRYDRAIARVVDRGAQIWRDETKKMPAVSAKTTGYGAKGIPVDSGRLRQSIQARRVSAVAAEVYAPVQYASYVHDGTGVVPERPFFDFALELGATEKIGTMANDEFQTALNA